MASKASSQPEGITIADGVVRGIYSNYDFSVKESQPLLVLHRDTVRSFFHEKLMLLQCESRVLAYLGVEITIITTLNTATFSKLGSVSAETIQGSFGAFSIIFGALLLREAYRWFAEAKGITPTGLANELAQCGAVINPKVSVPDSLNLVASAQKILSESGKIN